MVIPSAGSRLVARVIERGNTAGDPGRSTWIARCRFLSLVRPVGCLAAAVSVRVLKEKDRAGPGRVVCRGPVVLADPPCRLFSRGAYRLIRSWWPHSLPVCLFTGGLVGGLNGGVVLDRGRQRARSSGLRGGAGPSPDFWRNQERNNSVL